MTRLILTVAGLTVLLAVMACNWDEFTATQEAEDAKKEATKEVENATKEAEKALD